MRINKDYLRTKVNYISKEINMNQSLIYARFFFDSFLSRLAISKYKNKFILKGGLYLSSVLGIDSRMTPDIDFYIKKLSIEKNNIINILEEIISLNVDDGISFQIVNSSEIRLEDKYGGFEIKLIGKLDNIRFPFSIDIATGDPIIPTERNYDYKCLVSQKILPLKAYSLESVIAEKLETVLARGITNSRSKDFYDLYILYKTQIENISIPILKEAFFKTCEYRRFCITEDEATKLISQLSVSIQTKLRWDTFTKKLNYAEGLNFSEIINGLNFWINIIYKNNNY